ncbi:MAG: XRE family transcriptional regulator, partial [Candidatus Electrothrix sp. AUS1_2]|nr:XRE family transcriptional regulator [Candidatus Electrothrix sp. AUS1_2]
MEKITERINNLVEELAEGNGKKFADKANIKQATFYNYMNGRIPNVESLGNICRTYQVSLNWLIEGIGEKYLFNETKMVK